MITHIPVYIAHPTSETSGEFIKWKPGQKAKFIGFNGKTSTVTIMSGEPVQAIGVNDICIEVTFDDEGGKAYCVRAAQLRL